MKNTIAFILGISTILPCGVSAQERTFTGPTPCASVAKGVPYFGDATLDNEQTARDGTPLMHRVSSSKIYRDSQGRVRTEEPLQLGSAEPTSPLLVVIKDCGVGFEYTLDTRNRVAHRFTFSATSSSANPTASVSAPTVSTPTVPTQTAAPAKYQASNENLGTQTIEGLMVEGRRDTLSYPAGTWGYDRPIKTVHEVWMSKELGIIVMSRNSMPAEDLVFRLTNISRMEPDPFLFVVPAEYTIVDENGPFTIKY